MTEQEILQNCPGLSPEGARWMQAQLARQEKQAALSAEIRLAGGRSEEAVLALLDTGAVLESEDPGAAKAAVSALKAEKGWLFEPECPAAYSAAAGTAPAQPQPDAALRAAFGLE